MNRLQKYLEMACYEFGDRVMPDIVQKYGWDCPDSAELNRWPPLLKREGAVDWTNTHQSPDELLRSIANIRHTAVHRLRTSSVGLERFLADAEELVVVLGDAAHVKAVSQLRSNKQFLQLQLEKTQAAIAEQRAELNRKEQEAIDHIRQEDEKYRILAGERLEKAQELMEDPRVIYNGESAPLDDMNDVDVIDDNGNDDNDNEDDENDKDDENDNDDGGDGSDEDDDDDIDEFEDCDEQSPNRNLKHSARIDELFSLLPRSDGQYDGFLSIE